MLNSFSRNALWMVFLLSALFLWDSWLGYTGQGGFFSPKKAATLTNTTITDKPVVSDVPTVKANLVDALASTPTATPVQAADYTLENKQIRFVISSLGGDVVGSELLQYKDETERNQHVVLLQKSPARYHVAQSGLIGEATAPNHNTIFGVLQHDAHQVVLQAKTPKVQYTKTYTLSDTGYSLKVRSEVKNIGKEPLSLSEYKQLVRDDVKPKGESSFYSTFTGLALYSPQNKYQKIEFSDINKDKVKLPSEGITQGWVAAIQHYFVSVWLTAREEASDNKASASLYTRALAQNRYAVGMVEPLVSLSENQSVIREHQFLSAPQDQNMLAGITEGLDLVVDYGIFTVVAKPIFWLLAFLHGLVQNWGWAIVLLTVLVKAVFYPLSAASYRSMAKMKQFAPKINQLKEQFGDDRQKMGQEMMALYKKEKINPLGGCLPMVVQIPVFLALYWVLLQSVEMRQSPWLGWITDLSVPDPWYVLPAVMMVTSFVQIKLNPPAPDPIQQKMMMAMPLVFGIMFFFFPAGLVLYWLTNNVLSISQQWWIQRRHLGATAKK